MASIRRGYSDDFVIKNNKVGIGTSNPQESLDVVGGALQGQDLKVTGVSTQTAFSGFLRADHQIAENTEFSNINVSSLSGEIIVGTGVTVTIARVGLGTTMVGVGTHTIENTIDTTDITTAGGSQIDTLKVYNTFTPPNGGTNERPYAPKPGELYYNYDFKTIEFFDGNGWRQVDNTTRSGRIIFSPGNSSLNTTSIDTINAHTLGNAVSFGNLSSARAVYGGGGSNGIRGILAGGYGFNNTIDYVTMASAGDAIDFGDTSKASFGNAMSCSSTRAVIYLGYDNTGGINLIEYVQISTTGDSVDFGDSGNGSNWSGAAAATPTRGIYSSQDDGMQYITIASKGDAINFTNNNIFGTSSGQSTASSNSISMLLSNQRSGGRCGVTKTNIASLGRSIAFGELSLEREGAASGSTSTRTIFAGGNGPAAENIIDYFTITTSGSATDFGDLTMVKRNTAGASDSHGGLGGF